MVAKIIPTPQKMNSWNLKSWWFGWKMFLFLYTRECMYSQVNQPLILREWKRTFNNSKFASKQGRQSGVAMLSGKHSKHTKMLSALRSHWFRGHEQSYRSLTPSKINFQSTQSPLIIKLPPTVIYHHLLEVYSCKYNISISAWGLLEHPWLLYQNSSFWALCWSSQKAIFSTRTAFFRTSFSTTGVFLTFKRWSSTRNTNGVLFQT